MIQLLASTVGTSVNIDGINGAWSVPVYYAPAGTPLKQVCDTNDYRPCEMVPVPSGMFPSPDSDAKAVIVDQATNHAWSFYGMVKGNGSNGDYTSLDGAFGWGYTSTQGDGIHNYGGGMWGGRVAGWNYYAGLIHPEEIQAGVINHALAFFIPRQVATLNTYVWPAMGTDGSSTNTNSIPVGSHIQLDPSINVNTLPLTAGGKMIARALQVYGGWIADTGVAAAVDAQEFVTSNGTGINAAPWSGLLTYRDLYGIPVSSLRVLAVNQSNYYVEGSSPSPTPTHAATTAPTRTPTRPPATNTPVRTPTIAPTSGLPMSAPTVYDSMDSGAHDWKAVIGTWRLTSAAAYRGTGLGWLATYGAGVNGLRWNRLIDLRSVPNAYLWAQAILSPNNTAYVQVSVDGGPWTSLSTTINPSPVWYVPSINLSAYVGKIIQLQIYWVPKLASDVFYFDDVTVGVLQGAQVSMAQANLAQANVAPLAPATATTVVKPLALPNNVVSAPTATVPAVTSIPPTALAFPTVDISNSASGAAGNGADTAASTPSVAATDVPAPTLDSTLPTALPFPTVNVPVDVPSPTVTAPTAAPTTPTTTSPLPISAPTVYDDMDDGAHDWQATGNWQLTSHAAYQGTGLGWQATGGVANLLRWNRQIDLRSVPNAHLWVQSILSSADAPLVQVSNDGVTWTSIGTIPVSTDWQVASIDLTSYVGQVIQLQFLWVPQNPKDIWRFDDVTVGVLETATPAPTASPVPPTQTTAPTQAAPTNAPAMTQAATQAPTQAPTQVPPTEAPPTQAPPTQVPPTQESTKASK